MQVGTTREITLKEVTLTQNDPNLMLPRSAIQSMVVGKTSLSLPPLASESISQQFHWLQVEHPSFPV